MATETLHLAASDLQDLIDVLSVTLAPPSADDANYTSMYLFTQRQPYGDVGEADMLVGMSSSIIACGTASIVADGELSQPWLLDSSAKKEITPLLGSWMKTFGNDVQVVLRIDSTGASTLSVLDNPDRSVRFLMESAEMWPADETIDILSGRRCDDRVEDEEGNFLPAGKRVMFSDKALDTLAKISKKTKCELSIVPVAHPASFILVEAGDWRGAVMSARYGFETDVDALEVEFYDPREDIEDVSESAIDSIE